MVEFSSNKLPWTEVVSCVSLSDKRRAAAAKRFFENKRFANSKNHTKRSLIRRLTHAVFDISLPIIDVAQRITDEIREDSDAKALNACVNKIEELGGEGWRQADVKEAGISFRCVDLEIQLQPHKILVDEVGAQLLLYSYYRQSPPLSTDAIRSLLCLIRLSIATQEIFQEPRIVILDCYKDKSYEGSDFNEAEPWIAKQIDKVLGTFNAMYRIHLDGNPPPQVESLRKPGRRPRAIRANTAGFSIAPIYDQLCLQLQ
jgi:hypothetical protein